MNDTELVVHLSCEIVGVHDEKILWVRLHRPQQLVRLPHSGGELLDLGHDLAELLGLVQLRHVEDGVTFGHLLQLQLGGLHVLRVHIILLFDLGDLEIFLIVLQVSHQLLHQRHCEGLLRNFLENTLVTLIFNLTSKSMYLI